MDGGKGQVPGCCHLFQAPHRGAGPQITVQVEDPGHSRTQEGPRPLAAFHDHPEMSAALGNEGDRRWLEPRKQMRDHVSRSSQESKVNTFKVVLAFLSSQALQDHIISVPTPRSTCRRATPRLLPHCSFLATRGK